jgi:2-methylcitrate dehydratase PrpD
VRYETKDFPTFDRAFPAGVRLTMRDGSVREAELAHQRGGEENPLTDDEVRAKFAGNAALALGAADAAALEDAVLGVEELPTLDGFGVLGRATTLEAATA